MAKPISYRNLDISGRDLREEVQQPEVPVVAPGEPAPPRPEPEALQAARLRERAQAYMVYVNPEAAKTIAEFALARSSFRHKVKAHDVWLQAMEEFFERNGLRGPVRVPEKGRGPTKQVY
jgi:hypothetical protein